MMLQDADRPAWRVIGTTVGGNAQEHPLNREALRWLFPTETTALLAIASGQRQPRHVRSHEGARLAVHTTLLVLQECLAQSGEEALRPSALAELPAQLVQRWQQAVAETLLDAPLTPAELEHLEQQEGLAVRQEIASQPRLAYDATCLAVLVTPRWLLALRLGHGELLAVAENGQVSTLLPHRPAETPGRTPSPGMAEASQQLQCVLHELPGPAPGLVVLATAGYPKTFHNEAAFMLIGTNLLTLLRADGLERGQSSIEKWLTEAAQEGQGEDMTLAVLCRMDAMQAATVPAAPAETVLGAPFEPFLPVPEAIMEDTASAADVVPVTTEESVAADHHDNGTAPRQERSFPTSTYRPRSSRALAALAQCRRTKRFFQLQIESKGYGRWVVMQAEAFAESPARLAEHTFSGELSVDTMYPGCPYCQAERLAQCSCGQVACWDGTRRAITCPWCAVIGEGSSHIEELQGREYR